MTNRSKTLYLIFVLNWPVNHQELKQAAEFLDLPELVAFVHNIQTKEEFLNNDLLHKYRQVIAVQIFASLSVDL